MFRFSPLLLVVALSLTSCTILADRGSVPLVGRADAGTDDATVAADLRTDADATPVVDADADQPPDDTDLDADAADLGDTGTPATSIRLAGKRDHFCAIREGVTYCWGRSTNGCLGNGSNDPATTPTAVDAEVAFVEIGVGESHSCGLTAEGTAYCWGERFSIGIETDDDQWRPVVVDTDVTFESLGVGDRHTCALTETGEAFCWGAGYDGQLGDGMQDIRALPGAVETNVRFQTIAGGLVHTCGISMDGEAYCWGVGDSRLGVGVVGSDVTTPRAVAGDHTFEAITLGRNHTCALTPDGEAYCWGHDYLGSNGNGPNEDGTNEPMAVDTDVRFVDVSAGWDYTCAATVDGSVQCWGHAEHGILGNGDTIDTQVPVAVDLPEDFRATSVAAGELSVCASSADGRVLCWGRGIHGRLGNGELGFEPAPVEVDSVTGGPFASVAVGRDHTCATNDANELYCWGRSTYGRLGDDTAAHGDSVLVPGTWGDVAAGRRHTCAVTDARRLRCWGANGLGQLGVGDFATSYASPQPPAFLGDATIASFAVGEDQTCAIDDTATLYCWGENYWGAVGDGTTDHANAPTEVLDSATAVTIGDHHTCAIDATSQLFCWGRGADGRLGTGDTDAQAMPQLIASPTGGEPDFVRVSAGDRHTCALTDSTYCWGNGSLGALGSGFMDYLSPGLQVSLAFDPTALDAGRATTCATAPDGALTCWGWSDRGMTGSGRFGVSDGPTEVLPPLADVTSFDVGDFHACAVTAAGDLYCWGDLGYGAFGDGRMSVRTAPVEVSW